MDKQYYKDYYDLERKHWWFVTRSKIIKDQIKKLNLPSNPKILNVGAATFKTSEMLNSIGEVISLEYDQECCDFVQQHLKKDITQGSATDLKYESESFDLVCAFDVIEHIEQHEKAIQELKRVTKTDGYVFVTVPAYESLWSSHDEINHHFRRYTRKSLVKVFQQNNKTTCNFVRITYFNTILFPPIFLARKLSNLFSKKDTQPVSDFAKFNSSSISNKLLGMIFNIEYYLLKLLSFPFGVSIMLIEKK